MKDWLNNISTYISDYPGSPWGQIKIFVALGIPVAIAADRISETNLIGELLKNAWISKSLICLSVTGLLFLAVETYRNWRYKGKLVQLHLDIQDKLQEEFAKSKIIRVFASKGDSSKTNFIRLVQLAGAGGNVKVKVLLRGDTSNPNRLIELNNQIQSWRTDVDEASKSKQFTVETEFSIYNLPVMLNGFVFDDRCAILSWYSKLDTKKRSNPGIPRFLIYSTGGDYHKEVVAQAIRTFDQHFEHWGTV